MTRKYIELTGINGPDEYSLWVCVDDIIAIKGSRYGGSESLIILRQTSKKRDHIHVRETPEEIMEKI